MPKIKVRVTRKPSRLLLCKQPDGKRKPIRMYEGMKLTQQPTTERKLKELDNAVAKRKRS